MRYNGSPWPAAERQHGQYHKFIRGWDAFATRHPDQMITDASGCPRCGEVFGYLDSQPTRRLLLRMMHPVPEKRMSIVEALNDRWVKTIECCSMPDDDTACVGMIDVAEKKKCNVKNSGIKKLHNHLPPAPRRLEVLHPTF